MTDDPDPSDAVEEDDAEAARKAEQLTPRRAALEKLAEKYPPPQEWHDEPGWTDSH